MLGSRARFASAANLLARSMFASMSTGAAKSVSSIRSPPLLHRSLVVLLDGQQQHQHQHQHQHQQQHQQQRWYSNTYPVYKKKKGLEARLIKVLEEIHEGRPEIETMNTPEDMTEKEMYELLEKAQKEMEEDEAERWNPEYYPGSGLRRRPLVKAIREEDFDIELGLKPRPWRAPYDKRGGLLAIKVGMMPFWDDWGERHPTTVLLVDKNYVMGHKTMEKHGYNAVQIAAGQRKRKNVRNTDLGQYNNLLEHVEYEDNNPPYLVREFRVSDKSFLPPLHMQLHARHFVPGQNVDVSGISKGKGFQGGMKRWNFGGMPASHGVSLTHRTIGSTGSRKPGRVFKGKKMPGRMGCERVTVQNCRILKIDRGRNLIYVRGQVPGQKGNWVEIKDAVRRPLFGTDKVLKVNAEDEPLEVRPPLPTFEFDANIDGCGEPGFEEIMPPSQHDPLSSDPEVVKKRVYS